MNAEPEHCRQAAGNGHAAYYRQSRLVDAQHYRGRRLQTATPVLDLEECRLDLKVHRAGKQKFDFAWVHFTGVAPLPAHVDRAELHLEVLVNEGRYGFLLRLVRRGYLREDGQPVDLYRRVFRVLKRPTKVVESILECSEVSGENDVTLTPVRLAELVPHLKGLCVVLSGVHVRVNALFHNGLLHRVGSTDAMPDSHHHDDKETKNALCEMTDSESEEPSWQATPAPRARHLARTLNAAETDHSKHDPEDTNDLRLPTTNNINSLNYTLPELSNQSSHLSAHLVPANNEMDQSNLINESERINANRSKTDSSNFHEADACSAHPRGMKSKMEGENTNP